jgi:hypothetical protein
MIKIVWEFQVKLSSIALFEQIYGANGAWAALFSQSREYYGTMLLRDKITTNKYLTIDCWHELAAFDRFRTQFDKAYNELDQKCQEITLFERNIGVFLELPHTI